MNAIHNRQWRAIFYAVLTVALLAVSIPLVGRAKAESPSTTSAQSENRPIFTLRDLNKAFIDIAKTVTPTVVTVSTEKMMTLRQNPMNFPFMFDPFGDLFGDQQQPRQGQAPQRQFKQTGLGSGVIVSADGYILTNNHVVAGADSIRVRLFDGRKLTAKVVGRDERTDVAVIKVDADNLTPVKRGNSDSLQVGELVMAIGSPLSENLAHTVTQGIVSATGRQNVGLATYEDFIQTDAAINPGNSGGALVNLDGELVGINSAIATQSGGFQGIGFAIPSNMAFRIMDMLVSKGKVVRGWLGILPQDIDTKLADAMKLKENQGVLVGDVTANSPAQKAGLQSGDVILTVDGRKMNSASQLRTQIAGEAPGTKIDLTILRNGHEQDVPIELGELPTEQALAGMNQDLGIQVTGVTKALADQYGFDDRAEGVVVTDIDQNSPAYGAGLREGDLIRVVNHIAVNNVATFNKAASGLKKGDTVLMQILRQSNGFFLAFTLE